MKAVAKERVVDTAARLFYDQGYTATGINQIIEEAGVAKASLYQVFRSKEDLLMEYLDRISLNWMRDFAQFREGIPEGKKSILALFDYRIQLIREHQYKGCGFMRIAYELPGLEEAGLDRIQQFKRSVKTYVASHIRACDPSPGRQDAADLTETIYNFYEGSGSQAFFLRSVKPVEDARRIVQKFIP
jgi:AcrR family transcriptional regulator